MFRQPPTIIKQNDVYVLNTECFIALKCMDIDSPLYSAYFLEQLSRSVISYTVMYRSYVLSFLWLTEGR